MAQYYGAPPNSNPAYGPSSAQNLQFYPSSYSPGVPSHGTQAQGSYGYGGPASSGGYGASSSFGGGFGGAPGVSGRMGEQMGLRTGWLAAFSTEGYDGEPPLLEELGVNFGHIQAKVRESILFYIPIAQNSSSPLFPLSVCMCLSNLCPFANATRPSLSSTPSDE